jgi:D-glycero-D-manno-heptose 1,7-bisphosphate phosphatase
MSKWEPIVFVDRDGVINKDPIGDYIKKWEDFRFIPGTIPALKKLSDAGLGVVIISNQAGIGDGAYPKLELETITKNMKHALEEGGVRLRGIYYCLHGKKEGCKCRKPEPGLFQIAASDISFDSSTTYFIGDKITDMQAGQRYGLRTVFVLTGHGTLDRPRLSEVKDPDSIVPSIVEAADFIISKMASKTS